MKIHAVLKPYCNLMHDIKIRVEAMKILALNPAGLPVGCVTEFEQLQIRMISETLAVACLLVHGDTDGARTAKLSNAYQADLIIKALEKLHPRFYPRPLNPVPRDGMTEIENIKDGFLTKDDMLKSYRDSASYLHVGSLTEFLANETAISNRDVVRIWVKKLLKLLSVHTIYLADEPDAWKDEEPLTFADGETAPKFQIIVQMQSDDDEYPQAKLFQTIHKA
jgi:hypothetical protein